MKKVIYISNSGDDKNDGLTKETAVYSWKRACALSDGTNEVDATEPGVLKRITQEVVEMSKRPH